MAIASNSGGSVALDKVLATHERFRAAGFGVPDIVAMAAHSGGAPALQAVSDHLGILQTRYGINEIVQAGAGRRGAAGHVRQLAATCRVKHEAASSGNRGPATVLVERTMDQARTAFVPELARCDLTSGRPIWSLDESGATVVRHSMEPVPANNHKFPLRDLRAPLDRVHARYADDDGRCHPNVTLRKIDLASGYKTYFKHLCRDPRVGLAPARIADVRRRLLDNARAEFIRLLDNDRAGVDRQTGEPSAAHWPCEPRRLDRHDVPAHEHMLAGQYGLFLKPPAPGQEPPVLGNGRILGFYMGVFAANEQELEAVQAQHPDYERYALDAPRAGGKLTVYSAQGCANDLAFANTALQADAVQPTYDRERLNAEFMPFELQLTDKAGKPARETVIAVVALDNAIGHELRIDYGDAFLQQFKSGPAQAASRAPDAAVKTEAHDEESNPAGAAGQSRPPMRKRAASEAAPALPVSQDVPSIRSVRPRMTEPRGMPIEQLLGSRGWQIAGAMALMRRKGLSLSTAERLAGLPMQTLRLVSDEQGQLHSYDFQAALVQAAGADAPRLQELLAYLHQEQQRGGAQAMPQGTPSATPGLELFVAELEAALAATPTHAQPRPEAQP